MKQGRLAIVALVAAVAGALGGVVWLVAGDVLYETVRGKRESRLQVVQLATTLSVGMTEPEVASTVERRQFYRLRLYKDGDVWIIRAPTVLGAQEWLVVVSFEVGRVAGVGVRIGDSLKVKPDGAPQDKGRLQVRGEAI